MTARFNEPRLMGNCENCYYFTPNPRGEDGVCHRYPKALDKWNQYYCGEFAWRRDVETRGK